MAASVLARTLFSSARPAVSICTRRAISTQWRAQNLKKLKLASGIAVGATAGFALSTAVLMAKTAPKVDYKKLGEAIEDVLDDLDYDDGSYGPVFVRLAWHSSGTYSKDDKTGGSDGGTIRLEPECSHAANAGLDWARKRLEPLKKEFPDVSYADLYIYAGYIALREMGGPEIPFKPGRSDASKSHVSHKVDKRYSPDGRLPDAAQGAQHVRDVFYRMGMNDQEIVALIGGGHSIGRCHSNRSGYDGPWTFSPTTFSNEFFKQLLEQKWVKKSWKGPEQFVDAKTKSIMMLPTDMALINDKSFRKYVELYAKDESKFVKDFAAAFQKLCELGV